MATETLTFITGNAGKFAEAQALVPYLAQLAVDVDEIQELDPRKVIEHKLQQAFQHHAGPLLVEDTSLYLEGLHDLPGPLIKWFLQALGTEGLAGLVAKLDTPRAVAKTYLGYATSPTEIHFFKGEVPGQIVPPRGDQGFGWDAVFQPAGSDLTFAEMTLVEKQQFSMRRVAMEQLVQYLTR